MRVTAKITADNALFNIQQSRAKLDKLNEQISSGRNVNRPSDDPIATRQLLDIDAKIKQGQQYKSNISKATLWQKMTDTAINGMSDVLKQSRKLVSTIASGTTDPLIRQNAVEQLKALKQQMVDMGNTQIGSQYIFGGFETRNPPFSRADNLYHGSPDSMAVEINQGTTMPINVRGDNILLGNGTYGSVNILNEFDNLITSITANNVPAIQTAAAKMDLGAEQIYTASGEVQGRMIRLDSMSKLLDNQDNALQSVLSNIQTVDMVKAATELQQQTTAFEAALSATAKVSSLSLLDYLK